MIIHSYFTDGFFPWAKLFLESFRFHNGQNIPIKLDAINLDKKREKYLYTLYNNLEVSVHTMDLEKIAETHDIEYKNLLKQKETIETLHITPKSKNWKLLVAGDLRIKSIRKALDRFQDDILHFDIDTYIRSDLLYLIKMVDNSDICVRFRLDSDKENRKFLISVMGYKNNKHSRNFLDTWIEVIESKKLKNRPIGWGQTSYYRAYLKCKDRYKWGDIPQPFASAKQFETDKLWGGNTLDGKTINVKNYRKDFVRIKEKSNER